MEGPSLFLAAEQLAPFIHKKILSVDGNTRIGKERLEDQKVIDIFSWGKHLVFQFKSFALRVHFMLFGSFEAEVDGLSVTGDYSKKNIPPRLVLSFKNGRIIMYSCSLKYIESGNSRSLYDFSIDTISPFWDASRALETVKQHPSAEISDILLDQSIFAGVGNIIRNEVLFLNKLLPWTPVSSLKDQALKKIIETIRTYVFQFYEWRKQFVLKKHYQIYRQSLCPSCHQKVTRKKTGERNRMSFFCLHCQH
jgi:endonuclease-8